MFGSCSTTYESKNHYMQATNHTHQGIYPGFEPQGRHHQESKAWISGPSKGPGMPFLLQNVVHKVDHTGNLSHALHRLILVLYYV